MRKIGIVEAGQSGLQLAIGLREAGHEVVLLSAQMGQAIRDSGVRAIAGLTGPRATS